ncbi:glycoside hydrolase family 16 protein [Sphingomonas sp. KRR8]|uniref:glycoside hydrolase family 16 protein n=1 Tax=Sphingomonas sp. KRR8 TaxID=2942996 RepID=UPI00201FF1E5|nr:glycoside hydrolase family 16 protein [Sphingomonas sp. KRR8]URD60902.1 glycoside hydrolase family 16 protein [Sphingomonas sp. KRR8]
MITALLLAAAAPVAAPADDGYRLVWFDEFAGSTVDRSKWDFDVDCAGGGNEERQCYTARPVNASVRNGLLTITARRERSTGRASMAGQSDGSPPRLATKEYTSARLVTRGKAAWRYGRVEVRARLPLGQGSWPAIWMLPEEWHYGPWPLSGEIDIMEAVNLGTPCAECRGGRENHVLGTIHFGARPPGNKYLSTNTELDGAVDGFHTYRVDWTPQTIDWFVDGRHYAHRALGEWSTPASSEPHAPFDRPFHLILNLAIGGHLPEGRNLKGVSGGFPRTMQVDWVRVWQRPAS